MTPILEVTSLGGSGGRFSPDFRIACHFVDRVVDVHRILDHRAILKHLDLLGHAGDGEVVAIAVKLNAETHTHAHFNQPENTFKDVPVQLKAVGLCHTHTHTLVSKPMWIRAI